MVGGRGGGEGRKKEGNTTCQIFSCQFYTFMHKNLGTWVMNFRAGSTGSFGLALSVILEFLWPCLILCFSPNTVIKRLSQPPALSFCDCVAAAHFSHASLRCQQGATCFTLNYCTADSLRDPHPPPVSAGGSSSQSVHTFSYWCNYKYWYSIVQKVISQCAQSAYWRRCISLGLY